ncbi:MAG: hypothetical protein II567_03145 [Candidatus Riflebacteria bacterium]|nr:hypothetical protein [Candidatus Riflebacteria bacterium]
MKNSLKKLILAVVLSLLANVPNSYAQNVDVNEITDFKLSTVEDSSNSVIVPDKAEFFKGEFNLSLGSQMLSYQNTSKIFPSEAEHIETGFEGFNSKIEFDDSVVKLNPNSQRDFMPVITLNNSYEDNAIGLNDSSSSALSLSGKTGRLSFYGEYNQSNLTLGPGVQNTSDNIMPSTRASIGNVSNTSIESNISPSAISSDYYLEAVYSFKPTLKGKVAFKKTVIDTFDLKENVEVEGIVDATSDVSIKAGYSNENRSEIESKTPKEKKVWTEFILKF